MRMRRALIFLAVLLAPVGQTAYCEQAGSQYADNQYVQDSALKEKVLSIANAYVKEQLNDVGALIVKNSSTNTERRFSVVQVWDVVSKKEDVYTVQIDTDEMGGEPRYIVFLDLKEVDGTFRVFGIRIGPRHLRQSSVSSP